MAMQESDKFISKFPSNPSFTFRTRHTYITKSNSKDAIPSPNHYNPEVLKKNAAFSKFGKADRKSLLNAASKDIPGPGLYEADTSFISKSRSVQKQQKPFLTVSQRFDSKQKKIPGPGEYEIKPTLLPTSPKFSMARKQKPFQQYMIERNKWKPSPVAYQPKSSNSFTNLSMTIPKSQRMKSQSKQIPGPGSYISQQKIFSSHKSFLKKQFSSISQQKRNIDFSKKNNSPGPGNYQTLSQFQANNKYKKGFSLRSLLSSNEAKTPAPNQYKVLPNIRFKSTTSFKMPKEQRYSKQFKAKKQIPGPGAYDKLTQQYQRVRFKSLTTKFSKSQRKLVDINTSTDELFYQQIQTMKKTAPSFSIGHQNRKTDRSFAKDIPGPGAYNPQQKLTRQTEKINKFPKSARMSVDLSRQKIGPGTYLNKDLYKGTGVKFSKSKRGSFFQQMATRHMVISQISKIQRNSNHNYSQLSNGGRLNLKFNQHKIKQF